MLKHLIWNKNVSAKSKMAMNKTYFKPVLTFAPEIWTYVHTKRELSRLQALEIKILWGIVRKLRRDWRRSDQITLNTGKQNTHKIIWAHLHNMRKKNTKKNARHEGERKIKRTAEKTKWVKLIGMWTTWKGKYRSTNNTKQGKGKWEILPKIEEISVDRHTNTHMETKSKYFDGHSRPSQSEESGMWARNKDGVTIGISLWFRRKK